MNDLKNNQIILPFLNWAGGKRWLVDGHASIFPKKFNRYIEPFLGSGAVFFHLQPSSSVLSDSNCQLIEAYQAIKDSWNKVNLELIKHHKKHNKEYYYYVRSKKFRTPYTRAAQFIYLNRTCWNGLYRVNLQGKFNVPIGTKKNVILETDNFKYASKLLSTAKIISSDFEDVIDHAKSKDLLFIDPPYTVKHNFNGFVKYNEKLFSWDDQIRLRDAVIRASNRGAKIIITNADHKSIRALYRPYFDINRVQRRSTLAANNKFRGKFSEIIVSG